MKRIGVMAATAMIALLLALPLGLAMAQEGDSGNSPPATLFGTAMADGFPVPPGTMIVAMVGDEKVGSTEVMADGKFGPLTMMSPSGDDMMVSFMVGERMSDYMFEWMSGGAEVVMINANLVPDDTTMEGMRGAAGPRGAAGADGAAGAAGPAGEVGPSGPTGSLGIIALIVAIVAAVIAVVGIIMGRRQTA